MAITNLFSFADARLANHPIIREAEEIAERINAAFPTKIPVILAEHAALMVLSSRELGHVTEDTWHQSEGATAYLFAPPWENYLDEDEFASCRGVCIGILLVLADMIDEPLPFALVSDVDEDIEDDVPPCLSSFKS